MLLITFIAPETFEDKRKNDVYYSKDYLRKDNLRKEVIIIIKKNILLKIYYRNIMCIPIN